MRDRRSVWALWLLVWSLVSFGYVSKGEAIGYEEAERFRSEVARIVDARPRYVWGGSHSEASGLDCSGMVFLAARRAGLPVRRTTAERMYYGDAGWTGYCVGHNDRQELDLIWWRFKPTRPYGHVGIVFRDRDSAAHASSSRGYTGVSAIAGALLKNISGVRRLNHGE